MVTLPAPVVCEVFVIMKQPFTAHKQPMDTAPITEYAQIPRRARIDQVPRGVKLAEQLTNFYVYVNGPCTHLCKKWVVCREYSGGCGQ